MSDDEPSKSGAGTDPVKGSSKRRTILSGTALALLMIVGGGVLYVTGAVSGNEGTAGSCAADPKVADAVDANARGEVAAVSPVEEPFDLTTLAFKNGKDEPVSIGDFAGKTLLVNLWATWCVPCRAEMPALDALEAQQADENFAVVPINVDTGSPDKPRTFYEETGLSSLPFFRDGTMGVFNEMKGKGLAFGLPVSLIVDPAGCVRAAVNGPAEWASPDAVKLIDAVKASVGAV